MKKPKFIRQDSHKKKEVKPAWRRPKGLQSKMRLGLKGYRRSVSIGYGSPKATRYMQSGLKPVIVSSSAEARSIGKGEGIIIAGTVGKKKKAEIIKEAISLKLKILNIKDAEGHLRNIDEDLKRRKEDKARKSKEKAKKTEEKEKKAKEKTTEKTEKTDELAERLEKEEKKKKDKLLITKE
ncbi:MAG: eL32 family ribosomal protein [archaeon]